MVRNPMNYHQVSKIDLSPEVVDGIVFWTKNPGPMLDRLDELRNYPYYFQFTLTSYGQDVERYVPNKSGVVIPAFQRLSEKIGPERVIWRYDPIFCNQNYTAEYHLQYFEKLAKRLAPYTKRCVISFVDLYQHAKKNMALLGIQELPPEQQRDLGKKLSEIARGYGLEMVTCAEQIDLSEYGVGHGHCIDGKLLEKLIGCPLSLGKDKNQRTECGCVESIDIGAYNTCQNGCMYCYATFHDSMVATNAGKHDPGSPLLVGSLGPEDKVTERKVKSCKVDQTRLPGII